MLNSTEQKIVISLLSYTLKYVSVNIFIQSEINTNDEIDIQSNKSSQIFKTSKFNNFGGIFLNTINCTDVIYIG